MTTEFALIVAGGKGSRFGSHTPKQFLQLHGRPVLIHTIEAFYRYSDQVRIVLVLPEAELDTWQGLASRYGLDRVIQVVKGGESRFLSVRNGLAMVPDDSLVAIHDGVRPLVTTEVISESFRLAAIHGCAVASVKPKESLRILDNEGDNQSASRAVDRSLYRVIQTPQTFKSDIIRKSYQSMEDVSVTDDASVAERAGFPIFLFEGRYDNIKITTPEDLVIAAALADTGSL